MSYDQKLLEKIAQVEKGGAEKYHAKNARGGQALRPRAHPPARGRGLLRGGRQARQQPGPGAARGRRRHRPGHGRGPHRGHHGQRLHGEGRAAGASARWRRSSASRRRRSALALPAAVPRGLGRRAHHRPGGDVPRPPRRGPHLLQRGAHVRRSCRRSACSSGPRAAGGAYIPAFCDLVIMVDGNASMYLGSPRMAEMVIGEKVTLEEMGGAKMHCSVSGCGDVLVKTEQEAIAAAQALPRASSRRTSPSRRPARPPKAAQGQRQARRGDHPRRTRTSPSTCTRSSTS